MIHTKIHLISFSCPLTRIDNLTVQNHGLKQHSFHLYIYTHPYLLHLLYMNVVLFQAPAYSANPVLPNDVDKWHYVKL